LICNVGYAKEAKQIYATAVKAAQSGDLDSAFMTFLSLLKNYPESQYREDALFAIGEYYFQIGDFKDAAGTFIKFINEYPDSKAKPFVLVYLLKIAERDKLESLVKSLEKEIVTSRQLVLLFRDFKEYKYTSPLFKKHKVIHYIDKVEFYVEGQIFAKIFY